MINLTIDNTPVQAPDGSTVLQAARGAGITIPTLCDHPELKPYGGCRLCLVEIEGARTLQPSCTLPASENMVVRTNTAKVLEARKFILTLIFSERNHFCMYCQVSGGDCELQNAALDLGMTHWPLSPNYQPYAVDASHPYFVLDNNRCILCHRCIRACGDLVGNYTLGVEERGAKSFLVADLGTPLGQSSCISCGVCVQVCPTGALIDRVSAYRGKETQVDHHQTICVGCSVGCGIDVLTRDNHLVRIEGLWDSPVSNGLTCEIGRFKPLDEQGERITTPYIRKNGALRAATWEEALDTVVAHLKPAVGKAKDGVSAVISTRQSIETLTLFKHIFNDYMKSEDVTTIEEEKPSTASSVAGELGWPFEGTLADIEKSDCVVVVGANLVQNHQVVSFLVKRNLLGGTKLIVVDPAENTLDPLANISLKGKKGSDLDAITSLTTAVHQLKSKASPKLETAAAKTGIATSVLLQAAELIAASSQPVIIYGAGITSQANTQALKALVGFAQGIGGKVVGVKGDANSLSAAQLRLDKPITVNGHSLVYLVLGDDLPSQRLIKKLEDAPFMVVQASVTSQLTAIADVVLPTTTWLEQGGHYLNLDGRLQEAKPSLQAPAEVWTNEAVLAAVAQRLGLTIDVDWKEELFERVSPVEIQTA